jgi:hypothetical protein
LQNTTRRKEENIMINTAKVKGRIVEKGKTIQSIAPKIPCSPYTLGQKISNETPMNLEEAMILSEELEITKEEFSEFFLNKKLQNTTS